MSKKLITDISNTIKLPTATICADATNCYDRVAHPYASLCSQYFGMEICYLLVLFRTIQSMKMHLRTAFGVSTTFYSSDSQPFQGAVQGNGAAPALWLIISIFLIRYLHQQKVVTAITSPISKLCQYLAALLYVDDTDLYVFNNGVNSTQEIILKAQRLLNA